jgi:hypothetical protein
VKTCTECGIEKPVEEFHLNSSGYRRSRCKPCHSVRTASQQSRSGYKRARHLSKYGLTVQTYAALVAAQDGRCAACGVRSELVVDHCHASGAVRGLLCIRCNTALGVIENQELVDQLQTYLRMRGTR